MMVERYSNLKKEVGGLIPGCEISSLLDMKLEVGMSALCVTQKKKGGKKPVLRTQSDCEHGQEKSEYACVFPTVGVCFFLPHRRPESNYVTLIAGWAENNSK